MLRSPLLEAALAFGALVSMSSVPSDLTPNPTERKLLQPAPPAPRTPAAIALVGLVQRVHELPGS